MSWPATALIALIGFYAGSAITIRALERYGLITP